MKNLYTAHATAVEGRNGHVQTDDGNLSLELGSPGGQTKKTGKVTNPEQLFACGWSACFGSAVEAVAKKDSQPIRNTEVHIDIGLNQDDKGGYQLSAVINVMLTGIEQQAAESLVQKAHAMCPYSKATRGNIDVALKVNSQELKQAA